jgi:predicted kinase
MSGPLPRLVALGGLPGTGKSTLARALALRCGAVWLRIDTIERAQRAVTGTLVGPEGYAVAAAIAEDCLGLGLEVIADSVNAIPLTRDLWREKAARTGARLVEVEILCSDPAEHRARVEARRRDRGEGVPDWAAVAARHYAPWPGVPQVDTAGRTVAASLDDLAAIVAAA